VTPGPPPSTDRIVFRRWREDDLDLADALWGDPDVMRWIGGPLDRAGVAARLAHEVACERDLGVQYWPILRVEDGQHVGCCGLTPKDPAAGVLELGFHLRPEHQGRGLATEAARAAIAHAFGPVAAAALFAGHHPENAASARLLAKLGFRFTHRERYPRTGLLHPSYRLEPAGRRPGRDE